MPRPLSHLVGFIASGFGPLLAVDLIKADNAGALVSVASYVGASAAPTNADWIIFDGTFATTTAPVPTGGSVAVLGLLVLDPAHDVTISLANATLSVGANNRTSGAIDLSSSVSRRGLTLNGTGPSGVLRLFGEAPTLAVAPGRVLTINTPVCVYHVGGGSLVVSGGGTVNLNGPVRDGDAAGSRTTRVSLAGPGVLVLGGANTYGGGTAVGLGTIVISRDFAMSGANRIGLDAASGAHGTIAFDGASLVLGGSLVIDIAGVFSADATFRLLRIGDRSNATGGFSSVTIAGSYPVALKNDGAGLWSGTAKGFRFGFDQARGILKVAAVAAR